MTKTESVLEFGHILGREAPSVSIEELATLVRLAKRLHRIAERRQRAEDRVRAICEPAGVEPMFLGDPRGAVVKLRVASGYSNAFGLVKGVCVPII